MMGRPNFRHEESDVLIHGDPAATLDEMPSFTSSTGTASTSFSTP
jgi:hypothetical protein